MLKRLIVLADFLMMEKKYFFLIDKKMHDRIVTGDRAFLLQIISAFKSFSSAYKSDDLPVIRTTGVSDDYF